jgi:ribosomal protein S18 acetylase RimI-like enzyme
MPAVKVRDATAADVEAIARLVNRAFLVERFFVEGDRTSPAEISRMLESGAFLLAEADGRLVACVYVELRGERGYFGMLSVDPSRQGEGLGRRLVDAAEDRCRRRAAGGWRSTTSPGAAASLPPARLRRGRHGALPGHRARQAARAVHRDDEAARLRRRIAPESLAPGRR